MRRTFIAAAALMITGGYVYNAQAVWVDETVHYVKQGYHENVLWPWPYICPDRVAVREPFELMIHNGWRRQNLLGPHHFDSTNRLTTAGELRVHWVLTQAPPQRRTIYVERALDSEVTAERLATAREYATKVVLDGQSPQVSETHLISEGRPASVVDATNVRFQESMPPPVLPPVVGSGAGTQ
ncbi:MAG: hypothetical protein WD738_20840 [Pirellulales bacterium]